MIVGAASGAMTTSGGLRAKIFSASGRAKPGKLSYGTSGTGEEFLLRSGWREKADKDAATLREQVAIKETAALVESESEDLPEKVRAKLRRQFEGKAAKAEDVKQAVQDMREICESVGGKDEHGRAIIGNGPRITEPAGSRADDLKELRETFHGHFFGCKRDSYAPSAK